MGRLTAIVLGSAAGGGFPQWNCRCPVCQLAWAGDSRVRARTQASLAISANGDDWLLINASPDLSAQLYRAPKLHPRGRPRGSPIKAVLLTGAEIDQVAGLLSLRERELQLRRMRKTRRVFPAEVLEAPVVGRTRSANVPARSVAKRGYASSQVQPSGD